MGICRAVTWLRPGPAQTYKVKSYLHNKSHQASPPLVPMSGNQTSYNKTLQFITATKLNELEKQKHDGVAALLKSADVLMFQAKAQGKNRVCIAWCPRLNAHRY